MGKINDALEKYRKERLSSPSHGRIKSKDWKILSQFDADTGKLNLNDPHIQIDMDAIKRLINYRLINPDGSLTPAGLKSCSQKVSHESKSGFAKQISGPSTRPQDNIAQIEDIHLTGTQDAKDKVDNTGSADFLNPENAIGNEVNKNIPNISDVRAKKAAKTKLKTNLHPKSAYEINRKQELLDDTIGPYNEQALLSDENDNGKQQEIPYNSKKEYDFNLIDRNLVTHLKPKSFEAEQFKILRTNLFYPQSQKIPRSILVTSALPREGKSFISSNLALSIASDIDKHVLLIDCDLHNPSIHRMFGYSEVYGLSDYLKNQVPLNLLLLKTFSEKLTILPAGLPPDNPAELISSELMAKLLQEVSERYPDRFIIIDTPPFRLSAETSALARVVSGILLVIKYGSTPRKFIGEFIKNSDKDRIVGSILNNFTIKSRGYKKQYYGKYYQKYPDTV